MKSTILITGTVSALDLLEPHNIKVVVIEPGLYAMGFNELLMASKYRWFNENSSLADDMAIITKERDRYYQEPI